MGIQKQQKTQGSRDVWLIAALEVLHERGIDGIKIVSLARRLGLTSGSFYWHFKNVQDLLDNVLEHWETQQTVNIVEDAHKFDGTAKDRILNLMLQVIREDAATADHAISVWAKSDMNAHLAYKRTIDRRREFAGWMFLQAGFEAQEATTRGRLMVASLMGESSNDLKANDGWEEIIRSQWRVLVNR